MAYWRETHFKEEYCAQLIEHMKKGGSFTSFQHVILTPKSTMETWLKTQEHFRLAYEVAKGAKLETYEKALQAGILGQKIKGEKVGSSLLKFALERQFKEEYGETLKHEVSGDAPISVTYKKAESEK